MSSSVTSSTIWYTLSYPPKTPSISTASSPSSHTHGSTLSKIYNRKKSQTCFKSYSSIYRLAKKLILPFRHIKCFFINSKSPSCKVKSNTSKLSLKYGNTPSTKPTTNKTPNLTFTFKINFCYKKSFIKWSYRWLVQWEWIRFMSR